MIAKTPDTIRLPALSLGAASISALLLAAAPAHAGGVATPSAQWTGSTSDQWSDGDNWDTATPPQTGEDALITDDANPSNTTVIYANPGVGELNSVLVDGASTSNMTLQQGSDSLTTTHLTVGGSGTGTYLMSGGTLAVTNLDGGQETFVLARDADSTGTVTQTGGDVTVGNSLSIGKFGTGTYTLNSSDASASLTVDGLVTMGFQGTGHFHQSGSTTNTVGSNFYMGNAAYDISGGTLEVKGNQGLFVGTFGTSTFTHTGGTVTVSDTDLVIGNEGTGTYSHDNSQGDSITSVHRDLVLGRFAGSAGTYSITDGTVVGTMAGTSDPSPALSLTVTGDTIIGQAGTGTFNQGGGTVNANGGFYIGGHGDDTDSGVGTYNLTGGTLTAGWEVIGEAGIGTFNQSAGVNNANSMLLGNCGGCGVNGNTNASGTYNLSGGTLNVAAELAVSGFGYGKFNQTGGTANVAGDLTLGTNEATGGTPPREGRYNLDAGLLKVLGSTIVGAGIDYKNSSPGPTGFFAQDGGAHEVGGNLVIGQAGASLGLGGQGAYALSNTQGDASLSITHHLILGEGADSTGTFSITKTADNALSLSVGGDAIVGLRGTGTLTQDTGNTAGVSITGGLLLGGSAAVDGNANHGVGTYNLTSGTLTTGYDSVGDVGTGTFNHSGGSHTTGYLGLGATGSSGGNSSGTYKLSDTGDLSAANADIGYFGRGEFLQTGGTATIQNHLQVGVGPETPPGPANIPFREGIYTLEGGTLEVGGNTVIGVGNDGGSPGEPGGRGTFTQSGGEHTTTGTLVVGQGGLVGGGNGFYDLSGNVATSTLTTGTTRIGGDGLAGGTGHFTQSGGTHSTNLLFIGSGQGTGDYLLSGGLLKVTGTDGVLYVSEGGAAGLTQQETSELTANYLNVGILGGTAHYDLSGGSATVNHYMNVGGNGNGTVTQTGGGLTVGAVLNIDGNSGHSTSGSYSIDGATSTLSAHGLNLGSQGVGTFTQHQGTVTVNAGLTSTTYIGGDTTGIGTYRLTGGRLAVNTSEEKIGGSGTGYFYQSGGTHTAGAMYLGDQATGVGEYHLSGGSLEAGGIVLGEWGGTGKFVQNQADSTSTVTADSLTLARQPDAIATYDLIAGTLSTRITSVGHRGQGTFTQTGGTHTATESLVIGAEIGKRQDDSPFVGTGTYNLQGGTLNAATAVGQSGIGTFNNTGGTHNVTGDLALGTAATGQGTYNLDGTGETTTNIGHYGTTFVGHTGVGTFNQGQDGAGHTTFSTFNLVVGNAPGTTGTYNLYSGKATVDEWAVVGLDGVGHFNQSGGTVEAAWMDIGNNANTTTSTYVQTGGSNTITNNLALGSQTGANGRYELQDGSFGAQTLSVGAFGKGIFIQSGAGSDAEVGTVALGYNSGGEGRYTLSGGTLKSNWDRIGMAGTGIFTQTGGTHQVATTVNVGQDSGSDGTYQLSGDSQLEAGWESIGRYTGAVGRFEQSGGSNSVTNDLNVGGQGSNGTGGAGGIGTYQLTGGTLGIGGTTYVGNQGQGTFDQSDSTFTTGKLVLGLAAGSSGTYTLTDPVLITTRLTVSGDEVVGEAGLGTFIQHAGEHTVGGDLNIANQASANGSSFTLDNAAGPSSLSIAGTLFVGNGGNGSFDLNGGTLETRNSFIGNGGTGAFTQTAGDHTVIGTPGGTGNLFVGYTSEGTYDQSGGTVSAPAVGVGVVASAQGTYNLTGGSLSGALVLGYSGQGTFNQSTTAGASSVVSDLNLHLGELAGSRGSYRLDGGDLQVTGTDHNEIIGVGGIGLFTQNGGTHSVDGVLSLGGQSTVGGVTTLGDGTYRLNGGSLTVGKGTTPGWTFIGENGLGTMAQTNDSRFRVDGNLVVGRQAGSVGSYTLGDTATLDVLGTGDTGVLAVGHRGQGSFTQNGGQVTANALMLGGGPGATPAGGSGSYRLGGGALAAQQEIIGNTGIGTFTQTGGINSVTNDVIIAQGAGSGGSAYHLSGGALSAASLAVNSGGSFGIATGATATLSGTLANQGGSVEVANGGTLIGSGAFLQTGGLLTADGVMTRSRFDFNGGTLAGTGTLNGDVYVDGALVSPGHSPGTLNIDGNFAFTSGTLEIQIGGLGSGQFDLLQVTGNASFTGGSILFDFIDGFLPKQNDILTFLTADDITGWSNLTFAYRGLAEGFQLAVNQTGQALTFLALNDGHAEVPTPGTMALLGIGFFGWRRVRRGLPLAA